MPLTELRIQGLRTIENIRLKLDGLTVLIGDNGSGKSSIIEACELLRRAAGERFLEEFYSIHGGMPALLRQGAPRLKLGVSSAGTLKNENGEDLIRFRFDYDFAVAPRGAFAVIETESLRGTYSMKESVEAELILRKGPNAKVFAQEEGGLVGRLKDVPHFDRQKLLLTQLQRPASDPGEPRNLLDIALLQLVPDLLSIQVHLPFEVMPAWAARSLDRKSSLRGSDLFAPASQLEKLGTNLANAFHALKNNFGEAHWQETMSYVRLGLGNHVEDVTTWADPGGGSIGLSVKLKGLDRQVLAAQLSDGMLAYLAFVALFRLSEKGSLSPSLLAFDEPDLHLHPQLLMRVLDMLESMARDRPVLIATHSDRLLDGLSDPARAVVLCELDESLATRLVRPDAQALKQWLERYRGLGDLRSEGYEASVMTLPVDPGA